MEILSAAEAAEELNISRQMLTRHIRRGNIAGIMIGQQWAVTRDELERFKRDRRKYTKPEPK